MSSALRVLFCSVVLLACPPALADTRSDIAAALDYYAEMWNEGDLEALRGYYHPDFRLITDSGVVPLERRLADLQAVGESGGDRGELRHGELEILAVGDKHGMAYGRLSLRFKDGSSINGWFSTLFVNTPFGWKALLTHN